MERQDIFDAINKERDRQDEQWGGQAHDEDHNDNDWLRILDRRMVVIGENQSVGRMTSKRMAVVKLAAVAVAWLEVQ